MLANILGKQRTWVVAHDEVELSSAELKDFKSGIRLRRRGTPLPYILGRWEFYGRSFRITEEVLIPRPETELLVEGAINYLRANPGKGTLVDIGTGSGCVAVSIAADFPSIRVYATDISYSALCLARENASKLGASRNMHFFQMDLTFATKGPFDVVCANLPYVPSRDLKGLEVGQWEPHSALDGGIDGLSNIQNLMEDLPRVTKPGSLILLEIGHGMGVACKDLAKKWFPKGKIKIQADLAGRDRLLSIIL
jgi:release factor glutamine methyltransferase